MSRPKVLMASPNYWLSPFQVGSHHIARGFVAAGWDVAFVSDPISVLHVAGRRTQELRDRATIYRSGGITDLDGHLWAYVPGAIATPHQAPLLRSAWLHRNWSKLSIPNVVRAVRARGFGAVDLLYFDSSVQPFWLGAIPHRRSVLRIADRNAGFQHHTDAMESQQRDLARACDLVVYAGRSLEPDVNAMGAKRALHVPNGVDFARFAFGDRSMPDDLAAIPRPIAAYVGAIDEWFDFSTVNELVTALPEVSFVIIGPERLARQRLTPRPNLHLLGPRPYRELPRYLHHVDVGLIPFDAVNHGELIRGIHPLKLYEYLACGLPVVATDWEELAGLGSPAVLCGDPQAFIAGVRRALSTPPDRGIAVQFARGADWQQRVQRLIEHLDL
jgi:glycosyltransferase involved in cell wall biosynthesis